VQLASSSITAQHKPCSCQDILPPATLLQPAERAGSPADGRPLLPLLIRLKHIDAGATALCRFFPCIYNSSNSHNSIETASQLHRELTPEQIAALQQGSAAWHLGRSGHITGSTVTDLLGFDCPAINRLLAAHGVYHAVKDARQGIAKLQAATAKLRGEAAAAGTAHMGPFGMLCCEFGNRCGCTSAHSQQRRRASCVVAIASPEIKHTCRRVLSAQEVCPVAAGCYGWTTGCLYMAVDT
jgi:hypothetical protein